MSLMDTPRTLTPAQAARRAGVSRSTITRALQSRHLQAFRNNAGRWRIDADTLDAWRAARAATVQPDSLHSVHANRLDTNTDTCTDTGRDLARLAAQLAEMTAERDAWRQQAQTLAALAVPPVAADQPPTPRRLADRLRAALAVIRRR